MPKIQYSPRFARQYRKLPKWIQELAEEREIVFRNDPFDNRLKTHRLHGDLAGKWAFSISYSHRIIFSFVGDDTVQFHDIGGHDIYA